MAVQCYTQPPKELSRPIWGSSTGAGGSTVGWVLRQHNLLPLSHYSSQPFIFAEWEGYCCLSKNHSQTKNQPSCFSPLKKQTTYLHTIPSVCTVHDPSFSKQSTTILANKWEILKIYNRMSRYLTATMSCLITIQCSLTHLGPFWLFSFPKEPVTTTDPLLAKFRKTTSGELSGVQSSQRRWKKLGHWLLNGKHIKFWTQGPARVLLEACSVLWCFIRMRGAPRTQG